VEPDQHDDTSEGSVAVLGGEQRASELAAIHRVLLGRLNLGSTHALGGV